VRKDNHYLDCEAGAVAMAYSIGLHARIKRAAIPAAETAQQAHSAPLPVKSERRELLRPVRRPGFVKNWRPW